MGQVCTRENTISFPYRFPFLSVYRTFTVELFADYRERADRPGLSQDLRRGNERPVVTPMRGVVQLLLHDRQRDLVGGQKILHGDQLAGHPARRGRVILARLDRAPRRPPLRAVHRRHRGSSPRQVRRRHVSIAVSQLAYQVIQALLYHDGRDVQQGVHATASHHQKDEVCEPVPARRAFKKNEK